MSGSTDIRPVGRVAAHPFCATLRLGSMKVPLDATPLTLTNGGLLHYTAEPHARPRPAQLFRAPLVALGPLPPAR